MSTHFRRGMSIVGMLGVAIAAVALRVRPAIDAVHVASTLDGFEMSGSVDGLYPGASLDLDVTILNPQSFAIDVQQISGEATSADAAGCEPGSVVVRGFEGSLVIAAGEQRTARLVIEMLPSVADACQGAAFAIAYTGSAIQAGSATTLFADPVVASIGLDARVTFGRLQARLSELDGDAPVRDRVVRFLIGGDEVCRDFTDAEGVANCDDIALSSSALITSGYEALFDGDVAYQPSSDTGDVVAAPPLDARRTSVGRRR